MDAPSPRLLTDAALADALRGAGLRPTKARRAGYAARRKLRGHRSADEVLAEIRRVGGAVSRMTVYNALADLNAAGVLLRADAGPGRSLYEARRDWHHHFVCRECGAVIDVPCVVGTKPCLELSAPVGRADEAQVIFRGVCRACEGAPRRRGSSKRA